MTTRVELSYILKKHKRTDRFSPELPVQIPIEAEIEFLPSAQLAAEAGNAILGVRIQQAPTKRILKFVRRLGVAGLRFPEVSLDTTKFRKLRFRIITSALSQGQETDLAITYEIDNEDCSIVEGNGSLGVNWVVMVVPENGGLRLLHDRETLGPGGGNPCAELDCANTTDWGTKVKCVFAGCTTIF